MGAIIRRLGAWGGGGAHMHTLKTQKAHTCCDLGLGSRCGHLDEHFQCDWELQWGCPSDCNLSVYRAHFLYQRIFHNCHPWWGWALGYHILELEKTLLIRFPFVGRNAINTVSTLNDVGAIPNIPNTVLCKEIVWFLWFCEQPPSLVAVDWLTMQDGARNP